MGGWEDEMGELKEDMGMATYLSGLFMTQCASINRLTVITTTMEGQYSEMVEVKGVLATLQVALLE